MTTTAQKKPAAKKPTTKATAAAAKPVIDENALLAQFAAALLRDGTGRIEASDVALRQRVVDAFNRARVMVDEFKIQIGA